MPGNLVEYNPGPRYDTKRAEMQLQSSLLRAKRTTRQDDSLSKPTPSYRAHSDTAATRVSDLPAKRALRSVGKISTQLDPSHITPWQLSRLRQVRPDDPFTKRAVAYHAGLGGSASAASDSAGFSSGPNSSQLMRTPSPRWHGLSIESRRSAAGFLELAHLMVIDAPF